MGLKVLYKSGALGAGADIWVLPSFNKTTWARNIDWYLNFQLSKAQICQPKPIDAELKNLIKDGPLEDMPSWPPHPLAHSEAPLLVASSQLLPNRAVIQLPLENGKKWTTRVYKIWKQLDKPSLRLFLPRTLSERDFEFYWPEPVQIESIAVVPGI